MWDFHTPMESRRPQPTRTLTPFVNRIAGLQPIVAVHASNDSSYFVACQDGDSAVLVGAGGKQLGYCAAGERGLLDVVQCKGHRAPVTSSSPDPTDAKHFYTASQDGTARQWSEALFERKSLYVVKHGTGQLTDTVTVESVLGLSSKVGDGLFCTAGSDGLVQVWDCRVKYRPGGCAASWDVHALSFGKDATPARTGTKSRRKAVDPFEAAKHTGGMAEVTGSVATLAVRVGDVVKMLDLRKPFSKGGSLVCEPLRGLPSCGDTTPVRPCRDPSHFVTCTTREGYNHVVGGHVVQFGGVEGGYQCVSTWRSGRPDEDALSVCCGSAGEMFCGLSSGVVVVQPDATQSAPVCQWLGTRPSNESGEKRHRLEVDEEETIF
ncbi:hypothetical protein, conserved [Angomonas deanei]|uniref:WD domain, G-beta repeat n=1 Tax=Angomonas deanei TaxID=59799 RepID=A0A7G2CD80_9TRYP|nr:hypothetical protein, conserved [Angomonas deanei]